MRKSSSTWVQVIGLAVVLCSPAAAVAQITPPPTYGGDLWGRPRLSGDWFSGSDWLSKHGVDFDLGLTQVLQGVARCGCANSRNAG